MERPAPVAVNAIRLIEHIEPLDASVGANHSALIVYKFWLGTMTLYWHTLFDMSMRRGLSCLPQGRGERCRSSEMASK
jgi:hypothetical protein